MSELANALKDYLAVRRALGFKLEKDEGLLAQFVEYLNRIEAEYITTEAAMAWATQPENADPSWWASRLKMVRPFARYLSTLDPRTEVPPADLLPQKSRRASPYIYCDEEIVSLMRAARVTCAPLPAANYETLIGLLAVTGMRVGEAIRLDRQDVDWTNGLLSVLNSKFGKSREVILHESTIAALADYAAIRGRLCPRPSSASFFVSTNGTRLIYKNVHFIFHRLVGKAGLQPRSDRCRPRPHDLRHTFAVRTLIGWYREDADVQALLPRLSTYLGHVNPSTTYWYLSAVPELLSLAAGGSRMQLGGCNEFARTYSAGLLHRAAISATECQPAYRRRLPGHVQVAIAFRQSSNRQGTL